MIAIKNGKFFLKDELVTNHIILIEEGKIIDVQGNQVPEGSQEIDAEGAYITSGFIDLQIYGSGGNLFSAYPSVETLRQMDANLISKGTTGFLACVATNTPEVVHESIIAAKAYRNEANAFLGLHLEGPYLNAKRKGAHIEEYICKASLEEVKRLMEHADGTVKMMTIAAELQDDEVINYLLDQGVVLSMGHSDATFEEATKAYDEGVASTTHLFNAMPSIHHRAPNLPVAVFGHPTAMASIIADGSHVDFEVIKMSYKLMKDRLFLITDAVTACSIGPYQHQLSGEKFITPEGTLSGSNITLLQAVQNCVSYCDVPLAAALRMASLNPAKLMSLDQKIGNLNAGCKADLLFLSDSLELSKILKDGREHTKT
ncbi:N-acetylglucosamine-6-phosphate deacetylase [Pedobacter frigoris]|uniref:N-acetylglucosamine-6-phosphate deacetylase n=1 Tax=Pedobacter frigoris TaxID=2571272 RepID=A0A4U1CAD8_9SPHI|nr:N-acetylglucosamine-6-phosphate deacetylase [Pedobacter frigoris]TKC02878.1 N-acetylglucosamine-6-phosphate deacetylase [Pedobacter frigoris]